MLRITRHDQSAARVTLRLEGRLVNAWAELLERECSALIGSVAAVGVELSGVGFVDRSGVKTLRRLHRAGVSIRGCSDLLATILESEGIPIGRTATDTHGGGS